MTKIKTINTPLNADSSANGLNILFYISDVSSGHVPHVIVNILDVNGNTIYSKDRPLSDYQTLSGAQKINLGSLLTSLRDEFFTLEGFV